jgi:hypothetical protein
MIALRTILLVVGAGLLAGCAGMNRLDADVTSYSQWPAARQPGTYRYERLPSQQAQPDAQSRLEDAARAALEAAGFREAAAGTPADVSVQLGARITRYDVSPWSDPLWRGYYSFGWRHARRSGWGLGLHYDAWPRYDREVGVLIRDTKTGDVLYESRAASDGSYSGDEILLAAMFEAALKDFPQPAVSPRRVTVELTRP